ncbi:MAG: hypothetical protein NVSMB23_03470 [Myxococcales bacterium]
MAERDSTEQASVEVAPGAPSAADLLRATLEKIVFFEWRVRELSAELAAAQSRAAASDLSLLRAEEAARAAAAQAQSARLQAAGLEAERARLATLLARPAHEAGGDLRAALEAERSRAAQLAARLEETQSRIARHEDERSRWLNEMIAQSRAGDEAPAALAQFISELRGEVIALRDRQKRTDAQLAAAGLPVPPPADSHPKVPQPRREPDAVAAARTLWDEGRLAVPAAGAFAAPSASATPLQEAFAAPSAGGLGREGSAAQALAAQCVRGLSAFDAGRRAQAARHLAALPVPAAAPALAAALGTETDPKARAALARALVACGGETAAEMVARLLAPAEPPLVRLAALESLALLGGDRGTAALETAALDASPALRRRAAALARDLGGHARILSRLAADADASVRGAASEPLLEATAARAGAAAPPATTSPPAPVAAALPAVAAAHPARLDLRAVPPPAPAGAAARASEAPRPDVRAGALHAVRTAIFGLTEAELADALRLPADEGAKLAAQLVATGWLVRRGRRLIAGPAAEAASRAHDSSVSELNAGRGA